VRVFFGIVFKLFTPKFTEATEKSVFGEKQTVNRKMSKFRYERIRADIDSRVYAKCKLIGARIIEFCMHESDRRSSVVLTAQS